MNTDFLFLVSLLIILSNIYLLGTSRLGAMIRAIGAQGMLLSVLPLLLLTQQTTMEIGHIILLSTLSIIVKGYMIPNYLEKVIHTVKVKREFNPYVGYISSVLFGLIVSYASFALLRHMPFYAW